MEVKVFVGAVSNPLYGGWLTLPMDGKELKEKIASFGFGEREYEIVDMEVETEFHSYLEGYRDVYHLNQIMQRVREYEQNNQLRLLLSAICYTEGDFEHAFRLIESGDYFYYEDVYDEKSLGYAIVDSGVFGEIDDYLKGYLDYEAIGRDFIYEGGRLYPKLKTAFAEVV